MTEIWLGLNRSGEKVCWGLDKLNRHGLIAGATGTGKTVTLQVIAEQLSAQGVNVFLSDVKGDLAGLSAESLQQDFVLKRAAQNGLEMVPAASPVTLWDVSGENGTPIRLTIAELGPNLIAKLLGLSDVQTGVLEVVFAVAEAEGLLLLNLADLRSALVHVAENAKVYSVQYGLVSGQSVGAIQRTLLALERQGGESLFGEPALKITDLLAPAGGKGMIHILNAKKLMQTVDVYGVLLLYILSELFEELPEAGDLDKPKLVLFFDEAHLLFEDTPKVLLDKIEQAVRLIRSKGVGVFFVTQQPSDVPESVLAQLGNRVQHALRAATPQGRKDIMAASKTMASNADFDTAEIIPTLGVGEALISGLDKKGVPTPVQRTMLNPPLSRVGVLSEGEQKSVVAGSMYDRLYRASVDRESAAEILQKRLMETKATEGRVIVKEKEVRVSSMAKGLLLGTGRRQGVLETATKSIVRQVANQIGRELLRGLLGGRRR
ncbi:MAG: ATP-binding protein [Alphaproteobacteria bacterium CG_4_10_14_0_8_um_filter_53_9]|nr:MAG: ATP-binding protein [Alphaproteobacteria bacterium CG_4_10_14_0_8_um_filter_53_9]